jgi:steroid Delta-isomerase
VTTSSPGLQLENSPHPAQRASALSARYASERNKSAWLDLYAEDAIIQDPVGVSPLDPSGIGHRGRAALTRFWDMIIGPGNMTYRIRESYPCGNECANVWSLTNKTAGGDITVDLVSIYSVNAAGKLTAMRAFWSYAEVEQKLKSAIGG